MNVSGVLTQLISLFLMMFMGFLAAKGGLITPEFRKKLSALTLATAAPCTILSSGLHSDMAGPGILGALGVAAGFFVVMIALAALFARLMRSRPAEAGLDQLMLIFTNVGFMGIPVVESVYGATGVAMVAMFILCFNLIFFSYGVMLISGSMRIDLRSLKNPCIFAALGSLFFSLTGLSLPAPLEITLSSVGAINTPMSMLIIGASICHSDLREAVTSPRLYKVSFVRMLIMPLCILLIMKLLTGVLPISAMLAGVAVLMAAMPVAGNCAMLSDMYTPEDSTASQAVIVSTLMSAATLPLLCSLMSMML